MTRRLLIVLLLLPLWGCAARSTTGASSARQDDPLIVATTASETTEAPPEIEDRPVVATALVFDLPQEKFGQPLDLSRDGRQRTALLGYDEGVSEFYSVWIDDRQRENVEDDRYERRAVSVRTGARYR